MTAVYLFSFAELDGVERLGERADLVPPSRGWSSPCGLDALAEELDVRDEEIVADELDLVAKGVGELLPGRQSFSRSRPRSR